MVSRGPDEIDERAQRCGEETPAGIVEKSPEKGCRHSSRMGSSAPLLKCGRSQSSQRKMMPVPPIAASTARSVAAPACTRSGAGRIHPHHLAVALELPRRHGTAGGRFIEFPAWSHTVNRDVAEFPKLFGGRLYFAGDHTCMEGALRSGLAWRTRSSSWEPAGLLERGLGLGCPAPPLGMNVAKIS